MRSDELFVRSDELLSTLERGAGDSAGRFLAADCFDHDLSVMAEEFADVVREKAFFQREMPIAQNITHKYPGELEAHTEARCDGGG